MSIGVAIFVDTQPDAELSAPLEVEVVEGVGQMTTYRIRYPVQIVDGDLAILKDDRLAPGAELAVVVPDGDAFATLVKGPVYGQRIHLAHGSGDSYVDVLGADGCIDMDHESKAVVWSSQTDSAVVMSVLGEYGFTPDAATTATTHVEAKHALIQRETDYALVCRLARRNGFLFWMTSDAGTGLTTAHFKRAPVDQPPTREVTINLPTPSLDSLDIEWDVERPSTATAIQLDLSTKNDIDGAADRSPLAALGDSAFADIVDEPRTLHLAAPVDDAGDLTSRTEAALIEASFFVRARAATTAKRLKGVLRSHTVVSVRGAGARHSGNYLCARVAHFIDASAHTMNVELWRNAWNA